MADSRSHRQSAQQRVIDAALDLCDEMRVHAFCAPVPHTTPQLLIALFEEGTLPPGCVAPPSAQEPRAASPTWSREEIEAVISRLEEDAAQLHAQNKDDARAANMARAASMLSVLAHSATAARSL